MKLNISQLLEYQFCPVRWHHKYVSRRGLPPPTSGTGFSDGSYWHKLAEAWLKNDPVLPVADGTTQDAMRHFVEEGNLPKILVVHVEKVLEMPLGRHTLTGILDGIEPHRDKFLSLQWKTCAGGNDLERQCDAVKYSYHEAAYEALMNHNGFPSAGTHLGVYKKLTKGERAAGVWPLHFYILERPAGYVDKIMRELEMWADRMEGTAVQKATGIHFEDALQLTPHRRNCIIGNMRCQYFDTCYNGKPLTDESYVTLESRYEEPSDPTNN